MRRVAKVDSTQREIVAALRAAGRRVLLLHQVGGGCPDALVSWGGGVNLLMEFKSPGGRLTPEQTRFFATWPGPKVVVSSVAEALAATGVC